MKRRNNAVRRSVKYTGRSSSSSVGGAGFDFFGEHFKTRVIVSNTINMSAGFMYANQDIYRKNLRHIYSGLPPPDIRFRVRTYHSGIDHLTRIHEMQTKQRSPHLPLERYEYWSKYEMALPKAPAFKRLSNTDIHDLVTRLQGRKRPTEHALPQPIKPTGYSLYPDVPEHDYDEAPRTGVNPAPRIDLDALIKRLHYNGKTQASNLRQREPVDILTDRPRSSSS